MILNIILIYSLCCDGLDALQEPRCLSPDVQPFAFVLYDIVRSMSKPSRICFWNGCFPKRYQTFLVWYLILDLDLDFVLTF